MSRTPTSPSTPPRPQPETLARWDDEGGAGPGHPADSRATEPYKCTPVFDQHSLPASVRTEHSTKSGVWAVIRILEGRARFRVFAPASESTLDVAHPGLVLPEQRHCVEPLGDMRMQVEFYRHLPSL